MAEEANARRGFVYADTYEEAISWKIQHPSSILYRLILHKHLDLSSQEKRRMHHSLEVALKIAFKSQELLHMYGIDFQVFNVKTKEEIPVCAL